MSTVIKVENLSKQYRLGEVGTGTLSHDMKRWWHKIRGKEDPFLKIGETNDRTSKGSSDYVWALRDINFEIEQGDVVGIIGRNGAGKSTLLKILSKTTLPSTGFIKTKGRIASLLEVGTGFHPELSGRDNIFMNGAILGMTKREIQRNFDEIVAFAGVERYIDTPVKRYSSGMYVRLAFAVAAHLEPEILIVDEVLAVGDAEFQKKAIGKMQDVSQNGGRTVLFVSHNMGAVRRLCKSGIFMQNGTIGRVGSIDEITELYLKSNLGQDISFLAPKDKTYPLNIDKVAILSEGKNIGDMIEIDDKIIARIDYSVNEDYLRGCNISFKISRDGVDVFRSWDVDGISENDNVRIRGKYVAEFYLHEDLNIGTYTVSVATGRIGVSVFSFYEDCLSFDIENVKTDGSKKSFTKGGLLKYTPNWVISPAR